MGHKAKLYPPGQLKPDEIGIVPHQGRLDCMIDRYDVRASFDDALQTEATAAREYSVGLSASASHHTDEAYCAFEAYRDILLLAASGQQDAVCLQTLKQAEEDAAERMNSRAKGEGKAESKSSQAAIGYNYDKASSDEEEVLELPPSPPPSRPQPLDHYDIRPCLSK